MPEQPVLAARRPLRVLHVLPIDIARGAQVFARNLRERLDSPACRHRTLSLFDSMPVALRPDLTLGCDPGWLRRAGYDPRVARQLRGALRQLEPDVLVAHGGEPLKYCGAARPPGCRLVYYKIGSSEGVVTGRVRAAWHGRLLRRTDRVVVISEELGHEAITLFGADPGRLRVIPNGRDPSRYRCATHQTRSPVHLLFLAHLTATKRPLWFVELVRRLHFAGYPVEAVMAGDGPLLGEVREAASDLPIAVIGPCRPQDVPDLLASAHVLVFPSEPAGEGMPGVHIEAGLSGLPVVTTAVSGASQVVEQGVTGYVCPSDDLDALVRCTAALVVDPELRRAMGHEARARCMSAFSLDAVARSWAELLETVLLGRRAIPARHPGWDVTPGLTPVPRIDTAGQRVAL